MQPKSKFYDKININTCEVRCVEENFDIDAHINKIKEQMLDREPYSEQDENVAPEEFLEDLPNEEPPLEEYSPQTQEQEVEQADEYVQENPEEQTPLQEQDTQYEQWRDPFGSIYENDAVKKYVIYISKDFVPHIDNLDVDARSAYINEALQIKTELDSKDARWFSLLKALKHVVVSALVLMISLPALFWLANKSIIVTADNYSYVQKNFEKLYKERADRERNIRNYNMMKPPPSR